MKKIISIIICCFMLSLSFMGLAGCSKKSGITITCTMFDATSVGKDDMWKYLEKKFNVNFEFIPVTDDNFEEKNQLLIATQQMPDLMWLDLDESNFSQYSSWVKQGCFSAMPSLSELQSLYPNIYAQYSQENNLGDELMTINGKQYAHPCIRDNADMNFMSGMGWMYRRDWAKSLNLYNENDIYTWDEWIELCTAFLNEDPGNNGLQNIGMGTASYYFPMAFGVYQTSSEYGFGSFTVKNGEYKWVAGEDETLQGLLETKKLWDNGLIWQDNYMGESPDSYYTSGRMGMLFQNITLSRFNSLRETTKVMQPNANVDDACALAKVIGPDGTLWAKQSQCYYGAVVMSSKIKSEVKEKWLEILNWLMGDEGSLFIKYGIPDVDYKIVDNKAVCLWPTSETDPSIQIDPYPSGSRLFYECYVGAPDANIAPSVNYNKKVIETYNNHMNFMKENAFIRRFDYESSYFSSTTKDSYSNLQSDTEDKMMQLIVNGKYNTLVSEWNAWVTSKRNKVDPIVVELNSLITNKPIEHEKKNYEQI